MEKKCNECQNKGMTNNNWVMVLVSIYILISSIYGTIEIMKKIF